MARPIHSIVTLGAQDQTLPAFRSVDTNMARMRNNAGQTGKAVNNSFRMMRGGATQFGFQIQDIAVQLQGGQNLAMIIGQQGSQIASLFGTGGAIAGAIVAIGAALSSFLIPQLFKSKSAVSEFDQAMSEANKTMKLSVTGIGILSQEFEELRKTSESMAKEALLRAYNQSLIAVNAAQETLGKSTKQLRANLLNTVGAIFSVQSGNEALAESLGVTRLEASKLRRVAKEIDEGTFSGLSEMKDVVLGLLDPTRTLTSDTRNLTNELLESIDTYDDAGQSAEHLKGLLEGLAVDGVDVTTAAIIRNQIAVDDMVSSLQKEANTLGLTEQALAVYEAQLVGATPAEQAQIALIHDRITAWEEEQAALESRNDTWTALANKADAYAEAQLKLYNRGRDAAAKALEDERVSLLEGTDAINEAYDRRLEIVRNSLSMAGMEQQKYADLESKLEANRAKELEDFNKQKLLDEINLVQARTQAARVLAGALGNIFAEGTKEQRIFMAAQKGLAVGEAVMNMHRAIANANAVPWPANIFEIARATTTGLGALAGIRSVSFDGGGFTGSGARAGGIDGKGGFPAILHPNETVIDHTKGGGSGMNNYNFTIVANDTRGFSELLHSRRGEIVSMINGAANNRGRKGVA